MLNYLTNKDIYRILLYFAIIVLIYSIIGTYVISGVNVAGVSMQPTYEDGDTIFLLKSAYIFQEPQVGDVVVAKAPDDVLVLKRVTAKSGMEVEFQGQNIILNNDEYFICGDNTENSYDSRFYGPVSGECIIGKVIT